MGVFLLNLWLTLKAGLGCLFQDNLKSFVCQRPRIASLCQNGTPRSEPSGSWQTTNSQFSAIPRNQWAHPVNRCRGFVAWSFWRRKSSRTTMRTRTERSKNFKSRFCRTPGVRDLVLESATWKKQPRRTASSHTCPPISKRLHATPECGRVFWEYYSKWFVTRKVI